MEESDRDLLNSIRNQALAEDHEDSDDDSFNDDNESLREQIPTTTNNNNTAAASRRRGRKAKSGEEEEDLVNDAKQVAGKKHVPAPVLDQEALQIQQAFLRHLETNLDCQNGIRQMKLAGKSTLWVDFSQLTEVDMDLGTAISEFYYRFRPYLDAALAQAVSSVMSADGNDFAEPAEAATGAAEDAYQVSFHAVPLMDRVRDLRTERIGKLISVSGTVTRTSETRPELLVGRFFCPNCGTLSAPVEQEFKYSEPEFCASDGCKKLASSGGWKLDPTTSKFCDWQKIRVQENAQEVPAGSMPRSIEVIARYESVEQAKPGDKCVFTGTLIVVPEVSRLRAPGDPPGNGGEYVSRNTNDDASGISGLRALGVRDLTYTLHFLSCSIQQCDGFGMTPHAAMEDAGYEFTRREIRERVQDTFTEEEREEILHMSRQPNLLEKMKRSFAPAIYGHADVKLGVMLLLFGGVHKRTKDKINLRGDINVCIVGDPSTAKSQFLRYVCSFSPRAVYTSGKSSTAAGLTASVVRDPETGEFCIEAGALMLADNGVCCIDEFEKMDDIDQVAIHEAMEQQTLSITKAGIQATLNARTSVLAAANPIYGRYDRSKTLKANLTIGAAIMSRFDLFFVVLDEVDEINDRAIADHILQVHQRRTRGVEDDAEDEDGTRRRRRTFFSCEQLQRYLKYARTIDPICSTAVQPKLVECYTKLRLGDAGVGVNRQAYRITVRQLEALIRLSEAIARLHLDTEIKEHHVEKAYQLLKTSIVQVESDSVHLSRRNSSMEEEENVMSQAEFQHIGEEIQRFCQSDQQQQQRGGGGVRMGTPQSSIVDYILETSIMDLGSEDAQFDAMRAKVNEIIAKLVDMEILVYLDDATQQQQLMREYAFDEDVPANERHFLALKNAHEEAEIDGEDQAELNALLERESLSYLRDYIEAADGEDGFLGVPQMDLVSHLLENVLGEGHGGGLEAQRAMANRKIRDLVQRKLVVRRTALESSSAAGSSSGTAGEYNFELGTPAEEQYLLTLPNKA